MLSVDFAGRVVDRVAESASAPLAKVKQFLGFDVEITGDLLD
jgi:hypothetical protein